MATTSAAVTIAVTPSTPSSLAAPTTHPTPSYRIAMTAGAGAATTTATPAPARPRASIVNSLPEGLLGPPAQRPTRLSLPPKLLEQPAQALRANLPPPPPSPALRRRAAIVFYAIVAQFFLSIGCLFWVIATAITLFSFGLECSFNVGASGVLALVTFAFLVVSAQLIASALGVGAFNGKQQVDTKIYLLTTYLAVNLIILFFDAGLLFLCAVGAAHSFIYETDCAGLIKNHEYMALASFFLFFGVTVLLHLIDSAGISFLLCWTSELFVQRGSAAIPISPIVTTTTTTVVKEEHMSAPAPPIKRFSQV